MKKKAFIIGISALLMLVLYCSLVEKRHNDANATDSMANDSSSHSMEIRVHRDGSLDPFSRMIL